jgi:site-specific recombinase xerD
MKTTVSVVCYHHKILTNGESPIMLRICKGGKRTMKSLGISVHARYWDFAANQPKRNCPNRNYIQQVILRAVGECNALVLSKEAMQEEFTPRTLVHESKEEIRAQSVEEFYVKLIADLKAQGAVGTAYAYQNSYGVLRSFNKGRALTYTFGTIDAVFLEKFEVWMRARGNKDTTLSFQMRTLRAMFNRAIKAKIVSREKNPFNEYKISKFNTRTPKRALSKADMMKIIDADCSQGKEIEQFAHDIFVFSYLCGGISFVDIANLTPANIADGRLIYHRQKTHGAINVPLSEKAKAIIGKYDSHCEQAGYLFPILDERVHITPLQKKNRVHKMCSRVNVALRNIAKRLKIKATVTTYVARHSFATVLKKSGVNIGIISEALGHHSLKTTQIYLDSFENSQIDAAMQNLL